MRSHRLTAAIATTAAAALALTGCTAGQTETPTATGAVPDDIQAIMDGPDYPHARWGLAVVDLDTGERLVDLNADEFFPPGSTTSVHRVGDTRRAG